MYETETAINCIQQYCDDKTKFVFVHQIYSLLDNRSSVDSDLENLRKGNKFRFLSCEGLANSFANKTALMDTSNFMDEVSKLLKNSIVAENFNAWISKNIVSSISYRDIVPSVFSKKDVAIIVECGLFRYSLKCVTNVEADECVYLISHPALGQLTNSMAHAEKEITSLISRSKFKEISQNKLTTNFKSDYSGERSCKRRKAEHSIFHECTRSLRFPIKYYLLDLLGRGKIHRERNALMTDFLIRCA